ncbi:MAG: winged helix-turn-helix transcriptional regulator, partial [Ilumatobacteraceae bacterium]
MNRRPADLLDDLDQRIVGELARDGRTASSDLAHQLGITKSIATSRVRRLIESGIVHVTAVFDVDAAGYQWQANCFITSTGIAVGEIAAAL